VTKRRINDLALRQIGEIHDYIARHDAIAAQKVIDRIHVIIALVTERP
jgi:plasmid stabilization system protein ParE